MLNRYEHSLHELVCNFSSYELKQFFAPGEKQARVEDLIWYYRNPNDGRITRFLACKYGVKGKGDDLPLDYAFSPPYEALIKVWIIEVSNLSISEAHKQNLVSNARKILSFIEGELFEQSPQSIPPTKTGQQFIDFCFRNGLMPKIKLPNFDSRDRTADKSIEISLEKLPSEEAILTVGELFTSIFSAVNQDGSLRSGQYIETREALVMAFSCLSLASPNRTAAEVPVLPKQRLQSYSEKGGPEVFYLNWIGSKGYSDNNNHILRVLKEPIEKVVNYFFKKSEPARILCRFYENPNLVLGDLLEGFDVDIERKNNLSYEKKTNLFQLGYALGFYEGDAFVHVLKKGTRPHLLPNALKRTCFEIKPVYQLTENDLLSSSTCYRNGQTKAIGTSYASLSYLFGIGFTCRAAKKFLSQFHTVSVKRIQSFWIDHVCKEFEPSFPISYSTSETKIKLSSAMFCMLGSEFYSGDGHQRGSGGKPLQKSHFAIVPLSSLGSVFTQQFTSSGTNAPTIFERYGYSSELEIKPNQLRHYTNTLAHMSDIPVEIITAWSGRCNSEQTYTYIHTSGDARADKVRAIVNPPEKNAQPIRIISADEIQNLTNLPATITSTGICTQDLNVTPCEYINDCLSHCFLCPESCHIAQDTDALELLQKDLSFQFQRLDSVQNDPRLISSPAMQKWYVIHSKNTAILKFLIELMVNHQEGTVLRYSQKSNEFHLTDLETGKISKVKLQLPSSQKQLNKLLSQSAETKLSRKNPGLKKLLALYNINYDEEA